MNNIDFDAIDLTKEAPVTEPERQYYYIAKARKYVSEKAQEIGRDLTFCVTTFGCQMNARDSEKLVGVLELIGYKEEPDEEKADFVIYNTTSVITDVLCHSILNCGTAWCKEEKESAYVHRTLRMYDAGTDCCREDQEELSVC